MPQKIEILRSESVQEIISYKPSFLVRYSISIFFVMLCLFIFISWFIRYPDLVKGNLTIVAQNLPKSVLAKSEGKLIKLWVTDTQTVKKGQRIAYLEATANHDEVIRLSNLTDSLVKLTLNSKLTKLYSTQLPNYFQLGELQKSYQSFQEIFVRVKSFVGNGIYLQKKQILKNDLITMSDLKDNISSQVNTSKEDYELSEDEFNRQKGFLKDKIISKNDYNQLLAKLLAKKQSFEQMQSNLKNNEIGQNQKKQEVLELDKNITEQKNGLIQALYTLKSDIETWKQKYITSAPTSGKLSFIRTIQENQSVKAGQELMYILSEGEGYHGEMNIGQYNFGKVKMGQEVIVKLKSYPFEEYGTVKGKISDISAIAKDSVYFIKVNFPNGLRTSAQKTISFRHGTEATGEIITEDRRLIYRFLKDFMMIFER